MFSIFVREFLCERVVIGGRQLDTVDIDQWVTRTPDFIPATLFLS